MNEQLKQEAFFAKANENKANFDLHRDLIENHLCKVEKKDYWIDVARFAEFGNIDNLLLLMLIKYAEAYHEAKVRGV